VHEKDDYMFLAAMVCDPTTQTLIQTLENVQRIAAGFVINDYTSRTPGFVTSMLTSLEWQTLEQRRRISRLRSSINSWTSTETYTQCRTGVVADCFKFCGTRHARHTQLMSPRLCTTKHFTMTQLKLFTLVGVANLLLEVNPELLYGAGPNCGVW
jgi:hypothetical protein